MDLVVATALLVAVVTALWLAVRHCRTAAWIRRVVTLLPAAVLPIAYQFVGSTDVDGDEYVAVFGITISVAVICALTVALLEFRPGERDA